jgi:hypothetical protein
MTQLSMIQPVLLVAYMAPRPEKYIEQFLMVVLIAWFTSDPKLMPATLPPSKPIPSTVI